MITKKRTMFVALLLLLGIITISTPIYAVDSTNPADYFFYDNMEGGALTNTYANISNSSYTSRFAGQGTQSLQINSSNNVTIRTNILGANFTTSEYSSPFCLNYMVYENSSVPADNQEAGITFKAWANAISHNRNSGGSSANLTYINNSVYNSIGSPIGQNTWANITVCFTSGYSASGFTTGIFLRNGVNTANNSFVPRSDLSTIGFNNRLPSGGGMYIDLLRIWNYTAYGTSAPPDLTAVNPNITLSTRTPADITNTNLFSFGFATYNYTYNFSNVVTGYWANSTLVGIRDCLSYINGSCSLYNNTKILSSPVSNYTVGNVTVQQYNFSENYIYPTTSNINYSLLSTYGIFNITLSSNNDYYQDEILNISNITNYGYYEVPANSTGILRVYYYNRSYDFSSNPATSNNVHEFCVLTNITAFNHSHGSYGHQICPFLVNSSGYVGTVKMIGGGFLIRGNTQGITLYLGNITARTNVTRHTTNGGNTWSAVTGTILSHLHQFSGLAQFCVRGEGNYSGTIRNSTITCDTLDISYLPPEPSVVYVPNSTVTYNRTINITWEFALPQYTDSTISKYNISLYNNNFTFITNIVTGLSNTTNNYLWNTYAQNLSLGTSYIIGITANDSIGGYSVGFSEEFSVNNNKLYNISFFNFANSSLRGNLTTVILRNSSMNYTVNTTSGSLTLDIDRNSNYTLYVQPVNYSFNTYNITADGTNYTLLNTFHATRNSINISLYNGLNKTLINNWTLELISDLESNNYTTATGSIYDDLLTPTLYILRYTSSQSPGYPIRTYQLLLEDNSFNALNLTTIPLSYTNNVTFIVVDNLDSRLANATIKIKRYDLATNSYPIEQIITTNFEGKAIADIILNTEYYKFVVEYNGNTVLSTERSYIYGTTLTLQVNLGGIGFEEVFLNQDLSGTIDIHSSNNSATFYYNDETNTATQSCLYIFSLSTTEKALYNSSCSAIPSGDITVGYSNTSHNTYVMEGYVTVSGNSYLVSAKTLNLAQNLPEQGRGFGLLMTFILLVVCVFMIRYSLPIAILVGSAIPMFMSMTHLNSLSIEASAGMFILGGIVAYLVGSRT